MWKPIANSTEAMAVPGGMIVKVEREPWGSETQAAVAVSMVFVPDPDPSRVNISCSAWIKDRAGERETALAKPAR